MNQPINFPAECFWAISKIFQLIRDKTCVQAIFGFGSKVPKEKSVSVSFLEKCCNTYVANVWFSIIQQTTKCAYIKAIVYKSDLSPLPDLLCLFEFTYCSYKEFQRYKRNKTTWKRNTNIQTESKFDNVCTANLESKFNTKSLLKLSSL